MAMTWRKSSCGRLARIQKANICISWLRKNNVRLRKSSGSMVVLSAFCAFFYFLLFYFAFWVLPIWLCRGYVQVCWVSSNVTKKEFLSEVRTVHISKVTFQTCCTINSTHRWPLIWKSSSELRRNSGRETSTRLTYYIITLADLHAVLTLEYCLLLPRWSSL